MIKQKHGMEQEKDNRKESQLRNSGIGAQTTKWTMR